MLELLFLLLPIAAAYGWYMGRRSVRQNQSNKRKKISRDYFTGLNYLLSNESDKAVDLFISLLEVDNETIDTHLSLGALFRRRGEVDRAIRIHQNLISRPNLSDEFRDLAMMELGKDYLAAGFYDRAEEIFVNLIGQDSHSEEAETLLIEIYQVTKEWQKALSVISRISKKRQQTLRPVSAHFYCELATETENIEQQIKFLQQALKKDSDCGRALLKLTQIYLEQKKFQACKGLLAKLLASDAQLLADALNTIREVYFQTDDFIGYQAFLAKAIEKGAGATLINALAEYLANHNDIKSAENLILGSLYQHPTMKGFHYLMQLHISQAEDGQAKQSLTMFEDLVEQQIKYRPNYRCQECGFPSHTLYWLCPSCKHWGSIKRISGLDGE